MKWYLDMMIEYRGEHYAMTNIRRRISWFAKRLGPCKPLKEAIRVARNLTDVRVALDAFQAGGLRWFEAGRADELEDHLIET
ncbi:MAG: hypothetical protein H7210_12125 [Pyrinomonadaceae bacterium]|nr:hypothetical protein [Phycisphaerales bacterium]